MKLSLSSDDKDVSTPFLDCRERVKGLGCTDRGDQFGGPGLEVVPECDAVHVL